MRLTYVDDLGPEVVDIWENVIGSQCGPLEWVQMPHDDFINNKLTLRQYLKEGRFDVTANLFSIIG